MITELQQFDMELFLKINVGLSNGFFDWLMPMLRNRFFWAPLYLFIIVFSITDYKKRGYYIVFMLLMAATLGDVTSSKIIKKTFKRTRPCNEVTLNGKMISKIACGTGFSFPSSHATTHFAMATFLIGIFYERWKPVLPLALLWAISVCFAQIYVGVHYPIDILAGTVLGMVIGLITTYIHKKTAHKF